MALMKLPVIRGVIERRVLAIYRVDPDALRPILPSPFRLQLVNGLAVAGICMIRLGEIRPRALPKWMGVGSENAAHRIAVEWDDNGQTRRGVYIPRRDTSSRLNVLAGGRLFPGVHHRARFDVVETDTQFSIHIDSDDGQTRVRFEASLASDLPSDSIFGDLSTASEFFRAGAIGYSARPDENRLDGIELCSQTWKIEPLSVQRIESSFFDQLPRSAVQFDCALLMRQIQHEWHARQELTC
jgi:hypothetical protein